MQLVLSSSLSPSKPWRQHLLTDTVYLTRLNFLVCVAQNMQNRFFQLPNEQRDNIFQIDCVVVQKAGGAEPRSSRRGPKTHGFIDWPVATRSRAPVSTGDVVLRHLESHVL